LSALAVLFLFIYIFSYPRPASIDLVYGCNDPTNAISPSFIEDFLERGSFQHPVPYYGVYPENITIAFTPRDGAQYGGYIVPKYSLGMFIFSVPFAFLFKNFLLVYMPIMAVLVVVALYIFARDMFNERVALTSAIFAFVLPTIWVCANEILYGDLPACFFFLLGIIYLNRKSYTLSALLFSISVAFRYPQLMLVALAYLFEIWRGMSLRNLVSSGMIGIIPAIPLVLLNKDLYGSYLTTGYQVEAANVQAVLGSDVAKSFAIQFRPDFIYQYASMYIFGVLALLFLGIFLGLRKNRPSFAIVSFVITFLYYGSHSSWGLNTYAINAAILRYLLIPLLLLIPVFANYIIHTSRKRVAFLLAGCYIIISIMATVYLPDGIIDTYDQVAQGVRTHDIVMQSTEPNSVIITPFDDKKLYPDRNTLTAAYLAAIEPSDPEGDRFWEYPLDYSVIRQKATYLKNTGIAVYFLGVPLKQISELRPKIINETLYKI
jgi:hypothetical protein